MPKRWNENDDVAPSADLPAKSVTSHDLQVLAETVLDLADSEAMAAAWRCGRPDEKTARSL